MTLSSLVALAARATLVLLASWLGAWLLRRRTAAARHQLWALGATAALLLPLLSWVLPALVPSPDLGADGLLATPIRITGAAATPSAPTWPTWLVLAWLAGASFVALRALRAHLAAYRLVRRATPAGIDLGGVRVLRSERITSPMTVGILRNVVLLPVAADAWSPRRLRAVLMHELSHVRRHDTRIQLVAQLTCALYWWNPLAWLAAARLRLEREHACDDAVLAAGIHPSSYASDLLEVARCGSSTVGVAMADGSSTELRLRRVLDPQVSRRPLTRSFRVAVAAAMLLLASGLACTSAPMSPPAAPPPAVPPAVHRDISLGHPSTLSPVTFVFEPASDDPMELGPVATALTEHLGALEACYHRRLLANPTLAGQVVIHWSFDANGKVLEQCITEDTVGDDDLADCVNDLVRETRFPAGQPMSVQYPFVFAAKP